MSLSSTAVPGAQVVLPKDRVAFFLNEGYLVIDRLTTDEELELLRRVYDRLFEQRAGRDEGAQLDLAGLDGDEDRPALPQILNPKRFAPELADLTFRKNALAVAKQIFGESTEYKGEHMIYKPAHYGAATPWHQDQAYHSPDMLYRQVNFWMPLDEASVENGCLHFVPKSHTWDVLPHHHIKHDPRIHGLEVDNPDKCFETSVACPVPAGSASLHHSYLLHYAGANQSPIPRRAYIMTFALKPEPRKEPRVFPWQQETKTARLERAKQASGMGM